MPVLLDEYDLLVADSSALFRFFEAGAESTRLMMQHCAGRLHIVHDVSQEIERYRADPQMSAGISVFWEMLETEVIEVPQTVMQNAADILALYRRLGMGTEDAGETATVLYAQYAWEQEQRDFLVLMTDHTGGNFAEDRDVVVMKADDMLLDLVGCGAMTLEEGEVVWRKIFKDNPDIPGYQTKANERRAQAEA
jgi:hypothetical protein